MGTAGHDAAEGEALAVRQDDGAVSTWPGGSFEVMTPLRDFLETVIADIKSGKYKPSITPAKYGFKTPEEYWDAVRKLAGLKP